ncbi:MAG: hypothetical protein HC844_12140 [Tabrizicola sp.]|nr:hypothetical protein [Tabrizicola sp.]
MFSVDFPRLLNAQAKKTSEPTPQYNCIAWAFEDNTKWWWPMRRRYWPVPFDGKATMEAFQDYLSGSGWQQSQDRSLQAGLKKIALYANLFDGQPTHAARQLDSGAWTSKLGEDMDLTHELHELEGPMYGTVVAIFSRPR